MKTHLSILSHASETICCMRVSCGSTSILNVVERLSGLQLQQ